TVPGTLIAPTQFAQTGAANGPISTYAYNQLPQLNGRIDFDQAWGSASVMGAVGKAIGLNTTAAFDETKTTYAVGAGLKVNLPMIAAGDVLWLNAAYANGMTEYTTNWTSFKSSDTRLNVGGYVLNHPSWIVSNNGIETLKSWDVAGIFTHYWAPQWRHSFLASYGRVEGTSTSKALAFSQTGAFGDATVWNVGTQLAWLPTANFEIGVDVLYARVEQDIRRLSGNAVITGAATPFTITPNYATNVTREKSGNWTGRLRVERTF
ncbi:MAG: porin, partial [Hyphomicrobiales bacterium]|nr:porin [Hyphomicrobiales bacterium]